MSEVKITRRHWSPQEDDLLRRFYPDFGFLLQSLDRTERALRTRALRMGLGPRLKPWTGKEISRLKRCYPNATKDELLSEFPDRTIGAIWAQAAHVGVKQATKPRKPLPPLVTAVRRECRRQGLGIVSLSRTLGFERNDLSPTRVERFGINPKTMFLCVQYLGGELYVEWED